MKRLSGVTQEDGCALPTCKVIDSGRIVCVRVPLSSDTIDSAVSAADAARSMLQNFHSALSPPVDPSKSAVFTCCKCQWVPVKRARPDTLARLPKIPDDVVAQRIRIRRDSARCSVARKASEILVQILAKCPPMPSAHVEAINFAFTANRDQVFLTFPNPFRRDGASP